MRNHDTLAPFLAPHDPYRGAGFYSSMLLAKYATSVAAGTALFHLHACFKWSAAIGNEGMLGDAGWWQGKAMLAALSLALQKLPTILLGRLFHTDKLRRSRLALNRKPPKACGLFCRVGRPFAVVPWAMFVLLVVACFGITIVLTSTGFLQGKTISPGEDAAPQCGCGSTSTNIYIIFSVATHIYTEI